jgi:hypothetical protein
VRSNKRYTNATFTKRVDHEAGRHRTRRAPRESQICQVCGARYADRRWLASTVRGKSNKHKHWRTTLAVVCPACQRQREGIPSGYLYLEGTFLQAHHEEVRRLLNNEAERTAEDNPLARIMGWASEKSGRAVVTTTTQHLAQRLGHALEKAFSGQVRYDFSHENLLARVWWRRD